MSAEDLYQSWQSWRAYAANFNAHKTVTSMAGLYTRLVMAA